LINIPSDSGYGVGHDESERGLALLVGEMSRADLHVLL
jgi:hypothetical protein